MRVKTSGFIIVQKSKEFEIINENEDIFIEYDQINYTVKIKTNRGHSKTEKVLKALNKINIEKSISKVSSEDVILLTGSNIKIIDNTSSSSIKSDEYIFFMSIVFMFLLMVLILLSRIAAQITGEKGNQVTEVILTSLTRSQLFFSEVLADFLVILTNIIIVMLPMIVAGFISNPEYTSNFEFLNIGRICAIVLHMLLVKFCIIVLCVGVCSLSRDPEDSNAFSTIFMIPLIISYMYTVFNFTMFTGVWKILNYIPFFSIFPVLSALISKPIVIGNFLIMIAIDIVFIVGETAFSKRLFINNISKK